MSETYDAALKLIDHLNSNEEYLTNFLKIHADQIREVIGIPIISRENANVGVDIYSTPTGRRMILQIYVDRVSKNMRYAKPPVLQ